MSKDEFVIEMLALQFISDKTADSAAEYVELYRKSREQIKAAYESQKEPFNTDPLL